MTQSLMFTFGKKINILINLVYVYSWMVAIFAGLSWWNDNMLYLKVNDLTRLDIKCRHCKKLRFCLIFEFPFNLLILVSPTSVVLCIFFFFWKESCVYSFKLHNITYELRVCHICTQLNFHAKSWSLQFF